MSAESMLDASHGLLMGKLLMGKMLCSLSVCDRGPQNQS